MEQLLVDYDGCAEVLGLDSSNWLEEHIRELPHVRLGRYVRFSAENIQEIIRLRTVRPQAVDSEPAPAAVLNLTPGKTTAAPVQRSRRSA